MRRQRHEQQRAAEQRRELEGRGRERGVAAEEGHGLRAPAPARRHPVGEDADELALLDAAAHREGRLHRVRVDGQHAHAAPRVEPREERVDAVGVGRVHQHVHPHLVAVGDEPQQVEAPEVGADQDAAAPGSRELEERDAAAPSRAPCGRRSRPSSPCGRRAAPRTRGRGGTRRGARGAGAPARRRGRQVGPRGVADAAVAQVEVDGRSGGAPPDEAPAEDAVHGVTARSAPSEPTSASCCQAGRRSRGGRRLRGRRAAARGARP